MLCPEHPVLALGSDVEMQHFELQLWVTLSTGAEGTRAAHWQGWAVSGFKLVLPAASSLIPLHK